MPRIVVAFLWLFLVVAFGNAVAKRPEGLGEWAARVHKGYAREWQLPTTAPPPPRSE